MAAPPESWLRTRDVHMQDGPEDFGSLLLSAPVLEGLTAAGFLRPSPVQLKAIPLGRCGLDLIVQAKSGTGKTCVFSTVALDSVILENPVTQILILAPTREIAVQIHAVITTIGIKMEGLECHVFIGGTPLNQDKIRLKKCHIAVGSPGRIKQLIELDYLSTASIRLFILDEADKLLEEGSFQEQINWIYSSLPANKQMLAVSATYPESLANTLTRYMRDPTFVRLNPTDPSLIGLKQYYKVVNSYPLPHKTFEEKAEHLQELFSKIPFNQALVFSNLHSRAQHLADLLTSKGFPAEYISGSMNQNQRLDAMAKLKQFHCRVLISTDLTSRGIDAEKVNLVVNLDVPVDWETYMHRIGRAGRFGTLGLAVTYCCRGEEENIMMKIAQKCNLRLLPLPVVAENDFLSAAKDREVGSFTIESPEPITPELMEQFEVGDVEITAVPYPNASLPTSLLATKKIEEGLQHTEVSTSVEISPAVAFENPTTKSKEAFKQIQLHKVRMGHTKAKLIRNPQASSSNLEQKHQRASDVNVGQQNKEVDRETLQNMLPKIPCLSSFKNQHSNSTWSVTDFVKDYEYFIKNGLEREVEIIKSYTGPGEHYKHAGNDTFNGMESSSCLASAAGELTEESDSDISSCSSGSSICNQEVQPSVKASSDVQHRDDVMLSVNQRVPKRTQVFSSVPKPEQLQEPSPQKKKWKQNVKQSKQNSYNQSVPIPKPSKGGSTEDAPQELCFPFSHSANQSFEEYWKTYYRAWRHYYMEASRSYHRRYKRPVSMLTAYHANAVYFEELWRGNW